MVRQEIIDKIKESATNACAAWGTPIVNAHGAMSATILVPDGSDVDSVAERVRSDLDGVCTEWVLLSDWFAINEEDWTDEEERTILIDVDKAWCEFSQEEIAEHRKEHVIEIDPKWRDGSPIVFMPIKRKFFDAIARNEKKFEWRSYSETWVRKIIGPRAKYVKFQCGYEKNSPKMTWEIKDVRLADSEEEGGERYSPYDIPPMAEPQHIVIELGKRML